MSWWHALVLGLLQGITEFLPVSSSGHLALAQHLIPGFSQPGVVFDAMLHVGTAAAVVVSERREIARWALNGGGRLMLWLVTGTLATGLLAFPLRDVATAAFSRPILVGVALVMTGLVVASTRWLPGGRASDADTGWWRAAAIGLAQGAAVFPGLSRSGLTIAAGLGCGLERSWAARFSFLLGVPAILGATTVEIVSNRAQLTAAVPGFWAACTVGAAAAGLSGYVALRIVIRTVTSEVFHRFGWYCIPLGVVVVLVGLC